MKRYFILFLLLPVIGLSQSDKISVADVSWHLNYEKALKESKKENKNILVYFTGSDWCAPCKKLKTDFFETADFKAASENYVLLYVDIPMNKDILSSRQLAHNKSLLPKLNKKSVFPLFTVVDSKERQLDKMSGYNMTGEIRYHLEFMEKNKG
ncbi:MAG: thioredoxin family protein [Flavobacteriaceae bacterium]|nr:thioredoxin family protein [Flavobacteriaceae bacterium]